MKIEKINEDKIRIFFESEELKSRNIDARSFMYNSPETQNLFWDIMKEAEKKFGFSIEESMVYVEAQSNASGVVIITVTKSNKEIDDPLQKNKTKKPPIVLKRKAESNISNNSLFEFEKFEDFVSYCKVSKEEKVGMNSLYSYDSHYYLQCDKMSDYSILEFSTLSSKPDFMIAKINEYGKCIAKLSAISTIKNAYKF